MRGTHDSLPTRPIRRITFTTLALLMLAGHIVLIIGWNRSPARLAIAAGVFACAAIGAIVLRSWVHERNHAHMALARMFQQAQADDDSPTASFPAVTPASSLGWPAVLAGLAGGLYITCVVLVFAWGDSQYRGLINAGLSLCTMLALGSAVGWNRWNGRQSNAADHRGLSNLISGGNGALAIEFRRLREEVHQGDGHLAAQIEQLEARMDAVAKSLEAAAALYWRHLAQETQARLAASGDVIPITSARRPEP